MDSSTCHSSGWSISNIQDIWLALLLHVSCFVEVSEFNANSVDPDQTLRKLVLESLGNSPIAQVNK